MKNKTTLSLLAVLLTATFAISCTKDNTDPGGKDQPQYEEYCGRFAKAGQPGEGLAPNAPERTFEAVTFTENGTYILINTPVPYNSGLHGEHEYNILPAVMAGAYTVSADGTYTLEGFGSAVVKKGTKAGKGGCTIKFDPSKLKMRQYEVETEPSGERAEGDLFRKWNVDKTRIRIDGQTKASTELTGCNLQEVMNYFWENGIIIAVNIPADSIIEAVEISGYNEMVFLLQNGRCGSATLSGYNGSDLSLKWNGDYGDDDFTAGSATVSFEDGKCVFTENAKLTTITGETAIYITWVLSKSI